MLPPPTTRKMWAISIAEALLQEEFLGTGSTRVAREKPVDAFECTRAGSADA